MTPAAGPWSFLGRIWENDWVRFAVFTAAVSALVWLFVLVWPIFKFLILALFLAYLFDPVVDALERLRLSRTAAVVALIVGMIVLSVSVVVILLPTMTESVDAFVHKLPAYADAVKRWAGPMLEGRFDVALPSTTAEWYEVLKENGEMIRKIWESSAEPLRRILGQTFQGLSGFINALLSFIVVPVAWFYLLRDIDPLKEKVVDLFPPRHRGRLRAYAGEVDEVVSNFLRGQFTVCLVLATIYSVGLQFVADVPLGLVIGLFAGLVSIVPYLGLILGIGPALVLAALEHGDVLHPLLVVGVFTVAQLLEGNVITPKIVGDKLGLHPVAIIFAIMIWGSLLGLTGMIIAVPATAVLTVFLRKLVAHYRDSALFDGPAEKMDGAP